MPYRICFVTAEYAPLAKTGGLADVSAALTRYLHGTGHDVRPFLPLYGWIAERELALAPVPRLQELPLSVGGREYRYSVLTGRSPNPGPGDDLDLYFVDCPALYHRPNLYTVDDDEHVRFLLLTRAALECCQRLGFAPDVLHCNDWHTAFGPLYLRSIYSWDRLFQATRSVLTIHNVAYQGVFPAARAGDVGLGDAAWLLHQDDLNAGRVNTMKHGVLYADLVTTVSPGYAREIRTPEYGAGLDPYLRERGDRVVGILNGVDYAEWNPATDRHLPVHYSPRRMAGKAQLKRTFLETLQLPQKRGTMLLGLISRLVGQKGIDLLPDALPDVLQMRDLRFVALGSGEPRHEQFLQELQHAFPDRVVFRRGYSEEFAHWIEAASDAFLMPSRYEPCGLNQMYSLKYGTVPIVRRTGGLADSVQQFDPVTGEGTGIVFEPYDSSALRWSLHRALDLYADRSLWRRLMANGMKQDYSWQRQGAQYVEQYRRILGR